MNEKKEEFMKGLENRNLGIYKALAAFQQDCPVIHKGAKGHNYSYADLPAIFEVINPLLQKHGLGFTQPLQGNGILTILFHIETGETIESLTTIPIEEGTRMSLFQSMGSGITYFRRYAISSLLGIVTDIDLDAGKQTLSYVRYKDAIDLINKGKYTVAELKKQFKLETKQEEQIKTLG